MNLGSKRLKAVLAALGWSHADLANRTGYTVQTIRSVAAGVSANQIARRKIEEATCRRFWPRVKGGKVRRSFDRGPYPWPVRKGLLLLLGLDPKHCTEGEYLDRWDAVVVPLLNLTPEQRLEAAIAERMRRFAEARAVALAKIEFHQGSLVKAVAGQPRVPKPDATKS